MRRWCDGGGCGVEKVAEFGGFAGDHEEGGGVGAVGADFAGALAFEGPGGAFLPVDDFAGLAGDFGFEGELVTDFPCAVQGADLALELGGDHEHFVFEAIEEGFAFEVRSDVRMVGHGWGIEEWSRGCVEYGDEIP